MARIGCLGTGCSETISNGFSSSAPGPIVIGQACEFDYSGTQACKALRSEGLEVILINSNPATIMTDPEMADRTYIEPLTVEAVTKVIEKERPDAILPTVGGQTALNLAVALHDAGVLDKYGVKLIGANVDAIKLGEDRLLFRDAMKEIGVETPASGLARSVDEAMRIVKTTGFPAIIRPSFTMGGVGGGIAYNIEEFRELVERGLEMSPVHELLIEESVIGWKEFELEVMRDVADNFVVICSIENIDPMGVHTGDSITVAPALTLTDKEYQRMRDAARRIINRVGVETGGSNIQFCVNPKDGRMLVIEMNPRVSRSSALASKATGFPIAKIAAKLALGYHLDEIPNDITRLTPASFEPTIDYIVTKIPRWNFEKFPQADRTLTTQMKSVGEAMSIGRTFKESFLKGVRSLELGKAGPAADAAGRRRRRRGAAEEAGRAERPAHVGALQGARARLDRRAAARADAHRSVVPRAVQADCRAAAHRRHAGVPRAVGRFPADAEARRVRRPRDRRHLRRARSDDSRAAHRREARAGVQAHRHVRGRVRVVHAVHVQHVRARRRVESERASRRSSFSAAARTGSARGSSSTTAAVTRRLRCATPGSRRS